MSLSKSYCISCNGSWLSQVFFSSQKTLVETWIHRPQCPCLANLIMIKTWLLFTSSFCFHYIALMQLITSLMTTTVWLAIIILSRDILLGIAAIYYRYISLPPPKTFSRYWDFSLPSAEVHPTGISKVNTALQLGLIGWTVGMPLLTGIGWGAGTGVETALLGMQ